MIAPPSKEITQTMSTIVAAVGVAKIADIIQENSVKYTALREIFILICQIVI